METATTLNRPRRRDLFLGFFSLGITAFGGVLPLARRYLVEKRRWLTAAEFTELLSLCQFLPGGNIINLSVAVGMRFAGCSGALAAVAGLLVGPTLVVVGLGVLYDRYHDDPLVGRAFAGLAAAAAGLLVAMAITLLKPLRGRWLALGIALLVFVVLALFQLPLLWTMLLLTPLSVLLSYRWGL
ncbi:chromate transporter [Pseudomonas oryzihabitans]|nr:chromate transporter [Pseudomonas psychrotolerans]